MVENDLLFCTFILASVINYAADKIYMACLWGGLSLLTWLVMVTA